MKHGIAPADRPFLGASALVAWTFAIGMGLATQTAHAQEAKQVWEEYGKRVEASGKVNALGTDLFGDQVSLSNGALSFSVTDVAVPGNNALPVAFTRTFSVRGREGSHLYNDFPLADWEIDLPNISGVFAPDWISGAVATPYKRCSVTTVGAARPPAVWVGTNNRFEPFEFWQGHQLSLPTGGGEMMLLDAGDPKPSTGGPYYWVTADQTRVSCLSAIKNWSGGGEGFLAVAPDGTRYWFDWMAQYLEPQIKSSTIIGDPGNTEQIDYQHARRRNVLYPTRVEDRFGNWVTYTYTNARTAPVKLTKILSSDGRQIDVGYDTQGRVASVSTDTRTWQYQYAAVGSVDDTLRTVIQPDESKWTINFTGLLNARVRYQEGPPGEPWRSCTRQPDLVTPTTFTGSVTHPSGATGLFQVDVQHQGRTNVPVNCTNFTAPYNDVTDDLPFWPISHHSLALTQKTVSGPGLPTRTWSYGYQSPATFFYPSGSSLHPVCPVDKDCSIPQCTSDDCAGSSVTTVTDPAGQWVRYHHGNSYRYNEGKLLKVEVGTGSSTVLRSTQHTYDLSQVDKAYPAKWGTSPRMNGEGFTSEYHRPTVGRSIVQGGATFSRTISQLDEFANPVKVTRASTLVNNPTRTEVTAYHHNLSKWVLGQVASVTKTAPGASQVMSSATYHSTYALPSSISSFGKLVQSLTYNADGTVATVKDGNNNVTTLGSWYRGVPRSIDYEDGSSVSAVVSPAGWVTRATDENGYAHNYTYDAMGRLASIAYPSSDSVTWTNTTQAFTQVAATEYGIPAGHWRQTVSTGNGFKINYFDALWQPVLTREYDHGDVSGTQRFQRFEYDHDGRTVFASYPSTSSSPTTGTWSAFDALGRLRRIEQDSELGLLVTTRNYLSNTSGSYLLETNPNQEQTRTWFTAWDEPTEDLPAEIRHPEGVFTDIIRDEYGKPTRLTRRDSASSQVVSRHYVYDAAEQLCKTIEPETGATAMAYDDAGNLSWSASGLSLPSTTACDHASVATAARIGRTYDGRNRLRTLTFPDGNGDQVWQYTPDGLPEQVTTLNEDGEAAVVNHYTYNKRRLITGESLVQPGIASLAMGYAYTTNGHLYSHTYPSGETVDYLPNALGQPRRAGSYASSVSYFPNGAMKQFTYGNGIVHTLQQNARGLPERSRDAYGATAFLDDSVDYDANGNVLAISDGLPGARGNRDMTYDDLGRLETASSAMFGNASYSYDVLDNLRTVNVAGRNHVYDYDNSNRLTNVMTTAGATVIGLGYDPRGNLENKNGVTHRFDHGNRLREVVGRETYRYDAHGRRVSAAHANGDIYSMYGHDGVLRHQEDHRTGKATDHVYLNGSLVAQVSGAVPLGAPALTVPSYSSTGSYSVSWSASHQATKYQLHESANGAQWTLIHDAAGTSKALSGKGSGSYSYRVRACSTSACGRWSAIGAISIQLPPASPPALTVPSTGLNGAYAVSWTAAAAADRYQLDESLNGGAWAQIYEGAALSASLSGKPAGTHDYRVRACNDGGCSAASANASTTVIFPPPAPSATVPSSNLTGSYTVSWSAVAGTDYYQLQERVAGGSWAQIHNDPATSKAVSGKTTGTYEYRARGCNAAGCSAYGAVDSIAVTRPPTAAPAVTVPATNTSGAFTVTWTSTANTTAYRLVERFNGGSWTEIHNASSLSKAVSGKVTGLYEYRARSCNAAGCGSYGAIKGVQVTRPPTTAPSLTVPATNQGGSYTVSWTGVATSTKYQLQERKSGGSFATIHDAAGTSEAVTGRSVGTWEYRVRGCNVAGCGPFSALKAVSITAPPLPVPTGLMVQQPNNYSCRVTWNTVSGATRYELRTGTATIYSGTGTLYTFDAACFSQGYSVRACNSYVCSNWSAVTRPEVGFPVMMQATGDADAGEPTDIAESAVQEDAATDPEPTAPEQDNETGGEQ